MSYKCPSKHNFIYYNPTDEYFTSGLVGGVGYGAVFDLKYSDGAWHTNSRASMGRGRSSSGPEGITVHLI